MAVALLAGCSSAPEATPARPATTTTGDAHSRAVEIVRIVMPGATVAQAEEAMQTTCQMVGGRPTPTGVLGIRDNLVAKGFGSTEEVTALIGAAVAGTCPQYLSVLPS